MYLEVSDLANDIANKAAKHLSKKVEYVRCSDIEQYMTEVENIEFIDYKFKNNLNKLLLGSISKVQDEFIITTNKNLSDEYKNFTKMHDIILQKDYLPEDFDKEVAADIGAGILMVNDQALRYALKKFKKFNDISNYFNMSKSAFRVRTIQYLEFNEKFTYNTAYKLFKYFYCTSWYPYPSYNLTTDSIEYVSSIVLVISVISATLALLLSSKIIFE